MTWLKLDDQIADHPKFAKAGPQASWLWVCGLAYASRYLTDGFLPIEKVRTLGGMKGTLSLAMRLIGAGLWARVEGGFQIHDYHDYQPSAEQVKAEREAARKRKQKERSGNDGHAPRPAGQTPDVRPDSGASRTRVGASRPVPSRPVPSEITAGLVSTGVTGGAGGAPTTAVVGQAADAAVAPELTPSGKKSRRKRRGNGEGVNLGPLVDAFTAVGLPKPPLTGPEISAAQTLLKHYEPATIARCWQEIASGEYGEPYDRRHLSFAHLASLNRLGNWQREREQTARSAGAAPALPVYGRSY